MMIFARRIRGVRLVDVVAFGLLVAVVLGVYLAKTVAGRERSQIARIERQIAAEEARIRLLEAEVAHLEQPGRIEALASQYLEMAPVKAAHEVEAEALARMAAAQPLAVPRAAGAAPVSAEATP